jgi:hypothetical protein
MSSLIHFLEIKTKQQITWIVSLKSDFPIYIFPYKKISRYWLGGYACAVWPIVRVTCFGSSELSLYLYSLVRACAWRHCLHVRRISKLIFWVKLLLCKIFYLYYKRNSKTRPVRLLYNSALGKCWENTPEACTTLGYASCFTRFSQHSPRAL